MKLLLLDCDDSFTLNISDSLKQIGFSVILMHHANFDIDGFSFENIHGIVLSPGPNRASDIPVLSQIIQKYQSTIPILGICLGHQAIGEYYGHNTIPSIQPIHGLAVPIRVSSDLIFDKIDVDNFKAMRYNSLTVSKKENSELLVLCTDDTNEIMGFRHAEYPIFSFQFHPESIGTAQGLQLLKNWRLFLINFWDSLIIQDDFNTI